MLAALPVIDIFLLKPDVDELDPWAADFSSEKIPPCPGVYCFYDADTKEILYIGSACTRNDAGGKSGLRARIIVHRSSKNDATARKIHAEKSRRKLLARCWLAQSIGDALKYEADAIIQYKPYLNTKLAKPVQNKESRACSSKQWYRRNCARLREELPPDTTLKHCLDCTSTKPLSEFPRCIGRKDGHMAYCKSCTAIRIRLRRKRYSELLQENYTPDTTQKRCYTCGEQKALAKFSRSSADKDGRSTSCKECRLLLGRKLAQRYRQRAQSELPAVTVLKQCSTCKEIKPLSGFYRNTGVKSGRCYSCIDCKKKRDRRKK